MRASCWCWYHSMLLTQLLMHPLPASGVVLTMPQSRSLPGLMNTSVLLLSGVIHAGSVPASAAQRNSRCLARVGVGTPVLQHGLPAPHALPTPWQHTSWDGALAPWHRHTQARPPVNWLPYSLSCTPGGRLQSAGMDPVKLLLENSISVIVSGKVQFVGSCPWSRLSACKACKAR